MPTYTINAPDGSKYTVNAPEGATEQDAIAYVQKNLHPSSKDKKPETTLAQDVVQQGKNALGGFVRGAGSIGATLAMPFDTKQENQDRRTRIDTNMADLVGADPESLLYKGFKLGGEVAGTAGAGGLVANGLSKIPLLAQSAPTLINAVRSGGFGSTAGNLLTRSAGGAITGGVTAGLVDPEHVGTGAIIGGALPGAAQVAGKAGEWTADALSAASKRLMQSAIKPTIAQLKTGDAQSAVDTLLKYGINPNKGGVDKLREMIGGLNDQIKSKIANSNATVSKTDVLNSLGDVSQKFGRQVSPTADMAAIRGVADDFAAHPSIPGDSIPVQLAQDMKQGTYSVLSKKYGQLGSAETEAQKALARGLKEQIAAKVPDVGALNSQESQLINALNVSERRALMELNKNPIGLAGLAQNPISWAVFMADKSALFKSVAARMVNSASGAASKSGGLLGGALENPMVRNAGLLTSEKVQ